MENLEKQYEYVNSLTKEQKKALLWYTDKNKYYVDYNKRLREGIALTKEQEYNHYILEDIFKYAPVLEKPITVYRGLGSVRSDYTKTYISTSLDVDEAIPFVKNKCCIFEILVPPGNKVLPLVGVSDVPGENEVLLNKGNLYIGNEIKIDNDIKLYQSVYLQSTFIEISSDIELKIKPLLDIPKKSYLYSVKK